MFHVLNRGVRRSRLFDSDADYAAFERLLRRARSRFRMRVLAFCLMPNHFHLVLWPEMDEQLSAFMHWLSVTHTQRWHAQHGTSGTGSLYQGRFKSFPIQQDGHFLRVCSYVERNALRAGLCHRAEDWRWSSAWHRRRNCDTFPLDAWPVSLPSNWVDSLNGETDTEGIRRSVSRGAPYGDTKWTLTTAEALNLKATLRARGRPPLKEKGVGSLFKKL